jgi:peptidoglycan/xylan/chitin deacetylase (PgdA/CDA1 family)
VIVRSVLAGLRPGAVVDLHDGGGDRSQTVAALRVLLPALAARHYTCVPVTAAMAARTF